MSDEAEEHRLHVIASADERGEFVTMECGFVHYWPNHQFSGALSSYVLRWIADELDRRNAEWLAICERDLAPK